MPRFVRFVVWKRAGGKTRRVGVFSAAYELIREGDDLTPYDRRRLAGLLAWLEESLKVPPAGEIPEGALFWYSDVSPFTAAMWELTGLLAEYGFNVEQTTSPDIGRIVYCDGHQCAAVPDRRRR